MFTAKELFDRRRARRAVAQGVEWPTTSYSASFV